MALRRWFLGDFEVEEATVRRSSAGDLDVCFFSIGTQWSRELVPVAAAAGAVCVDKSAAFRLEEGIPLVVPEVNGERALEHTGIVANPNCCTIPLTMVLAPLQDAAGLRSVRVATYQSVSGAGSDAIADLRAEDPDDHLLRMDWELDGLEFDEEVKLREETRKILELPDLPVSASCVRVPVVVGHAESVWIETVEPLSPSEAERILARGAGLAAREDAGARTCHRRRRRDRGQGAAGSDRGERPRALPRLRQPPQGRGAQRDPDRRAARRRISAELLRPEAKRLAATWWRRRRRGRERLAHDVQHLLARALRDRLQTAEVQSCELDPAGRADRP